MNNFYITHNIFIKEKKYFFENEKDNTIIKLNKKNWFKYLTEYGWERLCINWRKRLKETNKSCFGILDCGSNGDCLFHVLSDALNSKFILNNNEPLYDYENLRLIASKEINSDNFELILNSYKLEKELNEFNGDWDPDSINSIEDLQRQITTCGDNFWGDHILLQLLQKKLEFNVIILNSDNYSNSDNIEDRFKIMPIASLNLDNYKYTIIIYYLEEIHFQLIGYFDGNKMITLFEKNELPPIILDIYNNDCRNN